MAEKKLTVYTTTKTHIKIVEQIRDTNGRITGAKVILEKTYLDKKITDV